MALSARNFAVLYAAKARYGANVTCYMIADPVLLAQEGYGNALRVIAFAYLGLLVVALLAVRSRLSQKPVLFCRGAPRLRPLALGYQRHREVRLCCFLRRSICSTFVFVSDPCIGGLARGRTTRRPHWSRIFVYVTGFSIYAAH